ncbi:MAG: sigma-70 family RNA polymerase sigma factor [Bacteroidota bacterium]|nr:sigma-70 family RNA polymerase sigma factor [Bacteroidota bacterium]
MFIRFKKYKKEISELADKELINLYKTNDDSECIGEIYKRYTHLIYGVCLKYLKNREESKDAVMQIFENLFVDLKKHEIENFKSWIYSVAKNHCLMSIRKSKTVEKMKENIKNDDKIFVESFDNLHHNNEEIDLENLEKGISLLKHEQQRCIRLMYLEGKSYKEVAEITTYSLKNVKSHIQNGKRNLKNFLAKNYEQQ